MNRREFANQFAKLFLGTAGVCMLPATLAGTRSGTVSNVPTNHAAKQFQAGEDYLVLQTVLPTDAPSNKIEVLEFFWYNCPHCQAFDAPFATWEKQMRGKIRVRRVPVAFRPEFEPQQRLYFALEALGLLDSLHAKVFAAIHKQNIPLNTNEQITAWVLGQGIDKTRFLAAFNAFGTTAKVAQATQLQNTYQVAGVPALGIAGRYYTDGTLAKGMPRALQVADYLVARSLASAPKHASL